MMALDDDGHLLWVAAAAGGKTETATRRLEGLRYLLD
jgi:hypothetical protein